MLGAADGAGPTIAHLAVAFGSVAPHACGHRVTARRRTAFRRSSEIAIRLALGAQARRVIAMILARRWLVAAGLALGSRSPRAAVGLIDSRFTASKRRIH